MADKTISELDAVSINVLPAAPDIYDNSLLVTEQQGEARKITGLQFKGYAKAAVAAETERAGAAADDAEQAKRDALDAANKAYEQALQAAADAQEVALQLAALYGLKATAQGLPAGRDPEVNVTFVHGFANFLFGIPAGEKGADGADGAPGPQGERGYSIESIELVEGDHSPGTTDTYKIVTEDGKEYLFYVTNGRDGAQGPQGEPGHDGVAVEAAGQHFFRIEDGHLMCYYTGDEPPAYTLEDDGHLYLEVSA